MVVAYRNDAPVLVKDVAQVVDGVENENLAAWMNQTPAVILNMQRQPGANTINVVKQHQDAAAAAGGQSARVRQGHRSSPTLPLPIRASVADVEFELMLTVGLVVMVIFLFLRSLSRDYHSERSGAACRWWERSR